MIAELVAGAFLGVLSIPAIHLSTPVDQGGSDLFTNPWPVTLNRGPAHYPETSYPWTNGLAVLSGHRTTYTKPFAHINLLHKGNKIVWKVNGRSYIYHVTGMAVVKPKDFYKLGLGVQKIAGNWTLVPLSNRGHRLVLVACHPPHLATNRIVVYASR